jgi:hypothetical protein
MIKVTIDSGAFSSWGRGSTIEIGPYINFLKEVEGLPFASMNLDVIPGSRRHPAYDPVIIEAAAVKSYGYCPGWLDGSRKT